MHVSLDEAMLLAPEKSAEVVAIDDALNALAALGSQDELDRGASLLWRAEC